MSNFFIFYGEMKEAEYIEIEKKKIQKEIEEFCCAKLMCQQYETKLETPARCSCVKNSL